MTTETPTDIARQLDEIRRRVAGACEVAGRQPAAVEIVAASKTVEPDRMIEAARAGIRTFGENRIQQAEPKIAEFDRRGVTATWRMIGHLQSNKINKALRLFDAIDSVDSIELAREIDSRATEPMQVLLEVNVAGEESKSGVSTGELRALVDATVDLPNLDVRGLMTIAPLVSDPELVRPIFASLRGLAERWGFADLSMGMTDDLEVAVEEGSTMIRVGRALFGSRQAHA